MRSLTLYKKIFATYSRFHVQHPENNMTFLFISIPNLSSPSISSLSPFELSPIYPLTATPSAKRRSQAKASFASTQKPPGQDAPIKKTCLLLNTKIRAAAHSRTPRRAIARVPELFQLYISCRKPLYYKTYQ